MPRQLNDPPLPRGWTKHVRSAFLHAVSLSSTALTVAWSRAAKSPRPTSRLQAELDRANTEIALLREELNLKDARWSRLASLCLLKTSSALPNPLPGGNTRSVWTSRHRESRCHTARSGHSSLGTPKGMVSMA